MTQSPSLGALANISAYEFRLALNVVCQALASHSSGSTAPSPTYPHMLWIDTSVSPAVLQWRTGANDAWVQIGQFRVDGSIAWTGALATPGTPALGDLITRGASDWALLTPGAAGEVLTAAGAAAALTWQARSGVASATLTGSSVTISGIPAGVTRVVVGLSGAQWSAGSAAMRLRTAAGDVTSGYAGGASRIKGDCDTETAADRLLISKDESGTPYTGAVTLALATADVGTRLWVATGALTEAGARALLVAGKSSLTDALTGITLAPTSGTWSAGTAAVRWHL